METLNLPWVIDARDLSRDLGLDGVWLINDLEANAYGLEVLDDDDFAVLNTGNPDGVGNQGVIAAGTGLGEAGLCTGTVAATGRSPAREATLISLRGTPARRICFAICSADSIA